MGKKDRQRKKLREFAKLKNRQRNLRKSVQTLKNEVQREAKVPRTSNQIALGNDKIEEINENSPLLSAPSKQEEVSIPKAVDIDTIDAQPLHEGPKLMTRPKMRSIALKENLRTRLMKTILSRLHNMKHVEIQLCKALLQILVIDQYHHCKVLPAAILR